MWYSFVMKAGRFALSVVLAFASFAACNKTDTQGATAEQPRVAAAVTQDSAVKPSAITTEEAVAANASPKVSEANFELALVAKGSAKAKQPAEVELTLVAKPPFHVNDKYPYKFKLKESQGVTYPAPVVGKEALTLEHSKATLLVKFTPESAGEHRVAGQFAFSVCTDDKCLIEKRDLALAVNVQ